MAQTPESKKATTHPRAEGGGGDFLQEDLSTPILIVGAPLVLGAAVIITPIAAAGALGYGAWEVGKLAFEGAAELGKLAVKGAEYVWSGGLAENGKSTVSSEKKLLPYFKKSYSALEQLTPIIKVNVKVATGAKGLKRTEDFFDIPYNFIKSLKLENKSGGGGNGNEVLTLTLEDPQGTISTILFAHLHYLSQSNGAVGGGGYATINILFGWGGANTFKIKKSKNPHHFFTTDEKRYMIDKADIQYENMKQKMTITARPSSISGVDPAFAAAVATPFIYLSKFPYKALLRNRAFLMDQGRWTTYSWGSREVWMESGKPVKSNALWIPRSTQNVTPFMHTVVTDPTILHPLLYRDEDMVRMNLFKVKSGETQLSKMQSFDAFRASSYTTVQLHPYLCFIYLYYHYLRLVRAKNEKLEITPFILFDEKNIVGWNDVSMPSNLTQNNWETEISNHLASKGSGIANLNNEVLWINSQNANLSESDTWATVLDEMAKKIKVTYNINDKPQELRLSFQTLFYQVSSKDNTSSTEVRKKTIEKILKEIQVKAPENVKKVLKLIGGKKDVLIPIIQPSNFTFNSSEGNPLQKYTVYPSTKITRKPTDTLFNAGSSNLYEENFPDVISFNPKINFRETVQYLISHNSFSPSFFNGETGISAKLDGIDWEPAGTEADVRKWLTTQKKESGGVIYSILDKILEIQQKFQREEPTNLELRLKFEKGAFMLDSPKVGGGDKFWITTANTLDFLGTAASVFKDNLLKVTKEDYKDNPKLFLEALSRDITNFIRIKTGQPLANTVAKAFYLSENIFAGESTSAQYNQMILKQKDFYKMFNKKLATFDAELKILGEPGFSINWGMTLPSIYLEVNAPDGTPNYLCTGIYNIHGVTQDIEMGKFTTTLQLKYDSTKSLGND